MARIEGVELPNNARIDYALTLLYGIGWSRAGQILKAVTVDSSKRVKELTDEEIARISREIDAKSDVPIEGELRRQIRENIQRLIAIGAYRGVRHTRNLPVRGQRTRTNARTKRGKRKTVGAFKKEMLSKMQPKSEEKK